MNEDRETNTSEQLCFANSNFNSCDRFDRAQILDVCDKLAIQNIHVVPIKIMILADLIIADSSWLFYYEYGIWECFYLNYSVSQFIR